jgi:hypothetical protein
MDLNYLYHRHQVSLMSARAATSPDVRAVHRAFASLYAARINAERNARPAGEARPFYL